MQKLVVAEICLLLLMLSVTIGSRCVKEERTRTGKNFSYRIDPMSFEPKFTEVLIECIVPCFKSALQ